MKLTAQIKLVTSFEQKKTLEKTMRRANSACDALSKIAYESKQFRHYSLQKTAYYIIRESFPDLSSQVVIRCISKVSDAYNILNETIRTFRPLGAISYDERILHWYTDKSMISIWTVSGRMKIPFMCGERQRELLKTQHGESDLVFRNGEFYLYATCIVEEPETGDFIDVLGVDLGIINIAVDSDEKIHSGAGMNALRARHRKLRQKLQKKCTKSAKRLLKKRSRKESRYASNENHRISKEIVIAAKDTNRAVAVEKLTGIRSRTKVRKADRATHFSWAFAQLRSFIEYKAICFGVKVIPVNPWNTSRTCPICGCVDKKNRRSQSIFSCIKCGHSGLADLIAARNIRDLGRAAVNRPYAEL